jgi:hypothetical protein
MAKMNGSMRKGRGSEWISLKPNNYNAISFRAAVADISTLAFRRKVLSMVLHQLDLRAKSNLARIAAACGFPVFYTNWICRLNPTNTEVIKNGD